MRAAVRKVASGRAYSSATSLHIPTMRIPTVLFPNQPFSMPVMEEPMEERPLPGSITPEKLREISAKYDGRLALLCDGISHGIVVRLNGHGNEAATEGDSIHVLGGERVKMLEPLHRTPAGCRIAAFAPLLDDCGYEDEYPVSTMDHNRRQSLEDEAVVARALMSASSEGRNENWELQLCQLDEELQLCDNVDPTAHPEWHTAAELPGDPVGLSWWLAARLPLTTPLRAHLLSLQSPVKRMRDVVDALRVLLDPNLPVGNARRFSKFEVLWQTAEASGCEVEPPRAVVHWRGEQAWRVSRY